MQHYELYLFFVTELLQKIPEQERDGATLILDEFGSATHLYTELKIYNSRYAQSAKTGVKWRHG